MLRKFSNRLVLSGTALTALLPGVAQAAGTVAGTTVANTATVGYSVGGTAQTPVTSNTTNFVVDRKVNLTVAQVGGAATQVIFGQANAVVTFTVTNNTNATQDFRLAAFQQLSLVATLLGHTDNYDVSNVRVFVDSNSNGQYDAGVDVGTFVDELAPDANATVFVVADIPATGPTNPVAGIGLTAIAAAGGTGGTLGADLQASLLGDSASTVDNVFADGAGAADLVRDGRYSALGEYTVGGATISAVKSAVTISDPLNGIVFPKAIPGAVVEYCIQVQNSGPGTATAIAVTDAIPANSTYLPGSLVVGGTVALGACLADGTSATDANDSDTGYFDGTKIHSTIATVLPLTTLTTRFRVTVN